MKKSRLLFAAGIVAITMYNSSQINESELSLNIEPIDLNFTGASYAEEYISLCDSVDANYKFEEYYISDEEIEIITDEVVDDNTVCYNSSLDREELINNIKNNTLVYSLNKDDIYDAFNIGNMYDEIDPEVLSNTICDTIWNTLMNDSSDEYENYCSMSNLKIVIDNNMDDATAKYVNRVTDNSKYWEVEDSYVIRVNMNVVLDEYYYHKSLYKVNPNVYQNPGTVYDYFALIFEHELNHVMQYACDCRANDGKVPDSIEICFDSYDGLDNVGNSLIEASAESATYADDIDNCKSESYIYEDYRKNEALLLLTVIFKDDISYYYDAIKNSSFEELDDFFDLDSDEDINNFYKALYSMEAKSEDNAYMSRINDAIYNDIIDEDNNVVTTNYVIDIYKLFLKNLISHISTNSDLSYEDSIFLNEFVKSILLDVACDYSSDDSGLDCDWNEDVSSAFVKLDEIFNSFIIEEYSISSEIIEDERDFSQEVVADIIINKDDFDNISNQEVLYKFPMIKNVMFVMNCNDLDICDTFDTINYEKREDAKEYIKSY